MPTIHHPQWQPVVQFVLSSAVRSLFSSTCTTFKSSFCIASSMAAAPCHAGRHPCHYVASRLNAHSIPSRRSFQHFSSKILHTRSEAVEGLILRACQPSAAEYRWLEPDSTTPLLRKESSSQLPWTKLRAGLWSWLAVVAAATSNLSAAGSRSAVFTPKASLTNCKANWGCTKSNTR